MPPKTKNPVISKKDKKEKKKKDPNAPKRPKSAYFFFMDDVRGKMKEKHPDAKVSELGKLMGEEWNKIKETDAATKYKEQAAEDKKRYEKAMETYKPSE